MKTRKIYGNNIEVYENGVMTDWRRGLTKAGLTYYQRYYEKYGALGGCGALVADKSRDQAITDKEIMTIQRAKELLNQPIPHYLTGFKYADVKKGLPGIVPYLDINHLKYCGIVRLNKKGETL